MTKAWLLGLALAFAGCDDDHKDRPYQLILDNNGTEAVDVAITTGWDSLEDHTLGAFEIITMWLSDDDLKAHPLLIVSRHSAEFDDDSLIEFTLRRSEFTGPDLSLRVTVYP